MPFTESEQVNGLSNLSVAVDSTDEKIHTTRFLAKAVSYLKNFVDSLQTTVDSIMHFQKNGSGITTRKRLNFIEGTNVTLTVADDSANNRVNVTIAAPSGGGGYTDEQAQDAVGSILTDSSTIDFTYDDVAPTITAIVKDNSISNAKISDVAFSKLSSVPTTLSGHSISDTKANFNTACSDGDFLYVGDISQYTDELAQDAVGAMIDGSLTYNDATPSLGVTASSDTVAGKIEIAIQSEMEAGTDATRAVTPARQHFHPSAAKFWLKASGDGTTINSSYNVTSITDTGAGRLTVTIGNDFSSANWACFSTIIRASTALTVTNVTQTEVRNGSQVAGSVEVECWDDTATTHTQEDPSSYFVCGFGDQ